MLFPACLGVALVFALDGPSARATQSITLAWDPNPEPDLAGYRLYHGTNSGHYSDVIEVGNVTNHAVTGLLDNTTNYFVLTAYNTSGLESLPSNPVSYIVPSPSLPPPGQLSLSRNPQSGAMCLGFRVSPGVIYLVQATQDFHSWVTLGSITGEMSPTATFEDPQATWFTQRFYRVLVGQ